jgi:hypothetical protein
MNRIPLFTHTSLWWITQGTFNPQRSSLVNRLERETDVKLYQLKIRWLIGTLWYNVRKRRQAYIVLIVVTQITQITTVSIERRLDNVLTPWSERCVAANFSNRNNSKQESHVQDIASTTLPGGPMPDARSSNDSLKELLSADQGSLPNCYELDKMPCQSHSAVYINPPRNCWHVDCTLAFLWVLECCRPSVPTHTYFYHAFLCFEVVIMCFDLFLEVFDFAVILLIFGLQHYIPADKSKYSATKNDRLNLIPRTHLSSPYRWPKYTKNKRPSEFVCRVMSVVYINMVLFILNRSPSIDWR